MYPFSDKSAVVSRSPIDIDKGRRKDGIRLADPVFNMADGLMPDEGKILNLKNRPFSSGLIDREGITALM